MAMCWPKSQKAKALQNFAKVSRKDGRVVEIKTEMLRQAVY